MITNFKDNSRKNKNDNMNDKILSRNFILEDRPIVYQPRNYFQNDMTEENNEKNKIILDKSKYFDDYYQKKKIIYEQPKIKEEKNTLELSFEEYLKLNS